MWQELLHFHRKGESRAAFCAVLYLIENQFYISDMGTRVCVDPGGNGAIMNVGGEGGPGPPGGGRDEQLLPGSGDG
jgi:hypothetical protein